MQGNASQWEQEKDVETISRHAETQVIGKITVENIKVTLID